MKVMISDAVYQAIAAHGKFGETVDDVLRRVFEISGKAVREQQENSGAMPGRKGRGNVRYAEKRLSMPREQGYFAIQLEGCPAKHWELPKNASDQASLRRIRDAAEAFARANGATEGQIQAIWKRMRELGYFITGPRRQPE